MWQFTTKPEKRGQLERKGAVLGLSESVCFSAGVMVGTRGTKVAPQLSLTNTFLGWA